jgi:hypothetical protein
MGCRVVPVYTEYDEHQENSVHNQCRHFIQGQIKAYWGNKVVGVVTMRWKSVYGTSAGNAPTFHPPDDT